MIKYFENFRRLATKQIPEIDVDEIEPEIEEKDDSPDLSVIPIEELELSVRAFNCLKRAEINMLDQLTDKTEDELTRVRNLGKKSVDEIKEKLAAYKGWGLHLKDNDE